MLHEMKSNSAVGIQDPVCGMEIKDAIKAEASVYKGMTYYFCSTTCKTQFEQNPERYCKKNDSAEHKHHHH